jgi:1,4-dihydroxy-2-naphthoate octaprenyltransferase
MKDTNAVKKVIEARKMRKTMIVQICAFSSCILFLSLVISLIIRNSVIIILLTTEKKLPVML